ncbi:Taste receptor type 2 member 114 [Lemmus lemmus]
MLSAAEGILLFISTSESVLGILGDVFIGVVSCNYYVKNKKLSTIGFIISGLAISRICLVWLLIIDAYTKLFPGQFLSPVNTIEYMNYLWVIINNLSVLFATSLSVFYFLKIANFSHRVFLWFKRRINVVFIFLIGCLLVTWLLSFPLLEKLIQNNKMQHRNASWKLHLLKSEFIIDHIVLNLGIFFFFMMTIIICFLIIISIWRHSRQMKLNVSGFNNINTEVHVKAMKILIFFIFLFILHFIGVFIETLSFFRSGNKLLLALGLAIACIYPCCHSFILILANSQLKQASLRALNQLKCCGESTDVKMTW